MNWAAILWLALMVFFLVMEASTVQLVSIWFAAGSLAALLVSVFAGPIWLQVLLFLAVSGVLLALLRPLARKYLKPRITRTNVDGMIGSTGRVTVAIDNQAAQGQIKLGAMEWTARSACGNPIPVGTQVRVERIEGVKAIVSPVNVRNPQCVTK